MLTVIMRSCCFQVPDLLEGGKRFGFFLSDKLDVKTAFDLCQNQKSVDVCVSMNGT